MKKRAFILLLALAVVLLSVSVFAHSGRTDSKGGHHVGDTSEYHYHHGYPAHDHPNGICPYGSNNKAISSTSTASVKTKSFGLSDVLLFLVIGYCIVYLAIIFFANYKECLFYAALLVFLCFVCSSWKHIIAFIMIACVLKQPITFLIKWLRSKLTRKRTPPPLPVPSLPPQTVQLPPPKPETSKQEPIVYVLPHNIDSNNYSADNINPKSTSKVKTFGKWAADIHKTEEQKRRIVSALRLQKTPRQNTAFDDANKIMYISGSHKGERYTVTLNSCTCRDFEIRKLPCKHIYYLALEKKLFYKSWAGIKKKDEEKLSKNK